MIDSDKEAESLTRLLQQEGYRVHRERLGTPFLKLMLRESFDFLILDWNLSDTPGLSILVEIRTRDSARVPILMLAADDRESSVVSALESGANDILAKPWRPNELLVRIKALLRSASAWSTAALEYLHGFELNKGELTIARGESRVKLTMKEFLVARTLLKYLGLPVSRSHFFASIWNGDESKGRTLDTHVYRVRRKLELTAKNGFHLRSVHNEGYRLDLVAGP